MLRPISKYFSSLENLLLVISKLDEGVTCKNMTASRVKNVAMIVPENLEECESVFEGVGFNFARTIVE